MILTALQIAGETWISGNTSQAYGLFAGAFGGAAAGIVGILSGVLGPRGKARSLVLGGMYVFFAFGFTNLVFGLLVLLGGHPFAAWYPFLLVGGVFALVVLDYNERQNSDEFYTLIKRPEMRYLRPGMRDNWINNNMYRRPPLMRPMQFAIWKNYTELISKMIAKLNQAGVPLLAGSDAVGAHGVLAGSSLHEELSLLVQAGLTPYEALQTATVNPAIYLGAEQEFGRIAEGMRADLVLLAGNPLDDIDNLRTRTGVMRRGRWFPAGELETALAQLAEERK